MVSRPIALTNLWKLIVSYLLKRKKWRFSYNKRIFYINDSAEKCWIQRLYFLCMYATQPRTNIQYFPEADIFHITFFPVFRQVEIFIIKKKKYIYLSIYKIKKLKLKHEITHQFIIARQLFSRISLWSRRRLVSNSWRQPRRWMRW